MNGKSLNGFDKTWPIIGRDHFQLQATRVDAVFGQLLLKSQGSFLGKMVP